MWFLFNFYLKFFFYFMFNFQCHLMHLSVALLLPLSSPLFLLVLLLLSILWVLLIPKLVPLSDPFFLFLLPHYLPLLSFNLLHKYFPSCPIYFLLHVYCLCFIIITGVCLPLFHYIFFFLVLLPSSSFSKITIAPYFIAFY